MMNYETQQAIYPPNAFPPNATEIRDASLRNKADEANGYLRQAHELMDELHAAIHGPGPREASATGAGTGAASHPGLCIVLEDSSASAANLVRRLQHLISSL